MKLTKEQEEMLLNPKPGTAAARARDFGIDLTLNLTQLRLTLEERLMNLEANANNLMQMREAVRRNHKV